MDDDREGDGEDDDVDDDPHDERSVGDVDDLNIIYSYISICNENILHVINFPVDSHPDLPVGVLAPR